VAYRTTTSDVYDNITNSDARHLLGGVDGGDDGLFRLLHIDNGACFKTEACVMADSDNTGFLCVIDFGDKATNLCRPNIQSGDESFSSQFSLSFLGLRAAVAASSRRFGAHSNNQTVWNSQIDSGDVTIEQGVILIQCD
jgi:hypothetical protein